jgi:GNAT superfamily N-acetyltransferase
LTRRLCARFAASVSELRIDQVDGETMLRDWQHVHNEIIPNAVLSLDEVRERVQRHHLEVAYLGDVLVGCSTVRPPEPDAATVIARVLPEYRRQGIGRQLYERGLAVARDLGASLIETIVLASNVDGLRFAQQRGFVETERYLLPGDTDPFVTLRLPD